MKKLLLLAIVAVAAWYGWNHRDTLLKREGSHEAVIRNDSGEEITRIRLTVNGQTLVKESLADGQKVVLPFRVTADSDFRLVWEFATRPGVTSWQGGTITNGPMLQRHDFQIMGDGSVMYHAESKGVGAK
jgi:hypothetical protein